jgi:hypothetical protein
LATAGTARPTGPLQPTGPAKLPNSDRAQGWQGVTELDAEIRLESIRFAVHRRNGFDGPYSVAISLPTASDVKYWPASPQVMLSRKQVPEHVGTLGRGGRRNGG